MRLTRQWAPGRTPRLVGSALSALREDGATAALWVIVTVPPSFGFWLVAGDLAGIPHSAARTLIVASLLAVGVATLLQVIIGYRLPVFEGPASTYLAAVAVVHASGHGNHARAIVGGLLSAAVLVFVLGLVGADRIIKRYFTPVVVSAFVVIVVITVIPDTLQRLIERSSGHPLGIPAAWVSSLIVGAVAVMGHRVARLRAFSLLGALLIGSLAYFLMEGFGGEAIGRRWITPSLFPWGAPQIGAAIVLPFLVSGVLASFNTVASVNVMSDVLGQPARPDQERRGVTTHGLAQFINACFGNLLGHVPRLDSVGVVRLLGNSRSRALAMASAATIALAFISPLVDLMARIPIPVSAALLAFVLALLALQGLRQVAQLDWRSRWLVFGPAIVPSLIWIPIESSLSHTAQLLANPLLIGVGLGVVLDRFVRRAAVLPVTAESS